MSNKDKTVTQHFFISFAQPLLLPKQDNQFLESLNAESLLVEIMLRNTL